MADPFFNEVIIGLPNTTVGGLSAYEFIGAGETYIYIKNSDGDCITINTSFAIQLFISGSLRSSSAYTVANDAVGTKVSLSPTDAGIQRVFPENAECAIYY